MTLTVKEAAARMFDNSWRWICTGVTKDHTSLRCPLCHVNATYTSESMSAGTAMCECGANHHATGLTYRQLRKLK